MSELTVTDNSDVDAQFGLCRVAQNQMVNVLHYLFPTDSVEHDGERGEWRGKGRIGHTGLCVVDDLT